MMRIVCLTILLSVVNINGFASDFFTLADNFFNEHVQNGRVAYTNIKGNSGQLDALLGQIESFDISEEDKATQIAFMINSYNILAIKGIVDNYPVKSPINIKNFFDREVYYVGGKKMSLNQLEKEILYPLANDPRLHFVLVCAAISCPKLANFAYRPDKLEDQIYSITKKTLNDPDFVQVDEKKFRLSEIFNWYSPDFTSKDKGVVAFINDYRESKLDTKGTIRFYSYNWDLNDQK